MSTGNRPGSIFKRTSTPRCIEPGEWPAERSRPRVLIESPYDDYLSEHADVLHRAGYDVAVCQGPTTGGTKVAWHQRLTLTAEDAPSTRPDPHTLCPLVSTGRCALVEGADVVVSSVQLGEHREVIGSLVERPAPRLVVEGPAPQLERDRDVIGGAVTLAQPVTAEALVAAVGRALPDSVPAPRVS